jgi:hypothetical protein
MRKRIRAVGIGNATNPFDNAITPFPQMKEVKIGRQLIAGLGTRKCPPIKAIG